MKRLNSLFTVAMLAVSVVVVSLAATSCSNDDDDNNGGGGESSTNIVVGTWSGSSHSDLEQITLTLTFKKDGTGTFVERGYSEEIGESWTDNATFSYEMIDKSTGLITVKFDSSDSGIEIEHYSFEIEGKEMYLSSYGITLHKK